MSKPCKGLGMELVKCLSESDCVKVEKRFFRECAGEKSLCIPSECVGLRETCFNCKRDQLTLELESVETRVTKSDYGIKLLPMSKNWLASALYSQTIDAPIIIQRG